MTAKKEIMLHRDHGLAPALTFCRVCGKETNELALLGAKADVVMKQVFEATGGREGGNSYRGLSSQRIPASEPCDECKGYLKGGIIFIARDRGEYLRLMEKDVDNLLGRIMNAKGQIVDLHRMRGKIVTIDKAFWYVQGENVRLRNPAEWA